MGDLRIGRVDIHHVDAARFEPAVGEVMIEAMTILGGQPIRRTQARPAVSTIHELVAEPVSQLGQFAETGDRFELRSCFSQLG